ncbi:hypothetical protein LAZ67_15001894 [Cordylochernes scorpioides]|uniref:Cadherin domain-containing protein n=1 Tax=Cordylochernes scorpioides TaxID=51811 RepID=A0ABY6L946_9ARAC|nr:hypothetical protein LAZ67_15001894 [Cordylochernes scorpioides]
MWKIKAIRKRRHRVDNAGCAGHSNRHDHLHHHQRDRCRRDRDRVEGQLRLRPTERLTSSSTKAVYGVVLRQPLNFSLRQAHRLLLVANDGNHNVTGTLTVRVGDVQNRPPQFVGSLTGVVSEDDPTGTTIMTVKAVDGDDQDPNQIAYFLVTNPDNSFFLHQDSGKLTLVRRLDREKYLATDGTITAMVKVSSTVLRCQDSDETTRGVQAVEVVNGVPIETPRTTAVTALTVTVKDVNDEPPTFNRDTYSVTIDEGLPDGTPLPDLDMFVSDPDLGSNSVFSLDLQDPTGMFEVDPTVASGSTSVNIRLKSGPLDYENPNHRKFILLVVAKESLTGANHASTSTVTIMVRDINDNPPEFFQDSYVTSIVEDALPETVVTAITHISLVLTIRCTSLWCCRLLTETPASLGLKDWSTPYWAMERTNSQSTQRADLSPWGPCDRPGSENCLDYESRPVYQLSYRAVDRGGLSAVVPLTIRLQDANDNPPKFRQPKYHAFIDEKARRFDPPFFIEKQHYTASIPESTPNETLVEQIVATDADRDQNAQLLYRIQKGAFDDFAINISSGSVSVVRSLDFDRRSSYVMEVVAVDGGSPARTGTATLTVHILNNNDKSPQFSPSTQRTHISEDATVGTVFYQLAAHDPDAQGGLRYGLSGPTTAVDKDGRPLASAEDFKEKWVFQNYFSVEPATGKVEVARALERDRAAIVSLTVTAVDTSAFPPQTGTDVNDYPPAFLPPWTPESPRLTIAVPEEQPLGSAVTTLTATDPDSNIARYDIVPLSPYFDIEPSTGIVRTKARLDYEEVKQVKINVVAYDAGVPQMSAIAMVTVDVINVNDHSPVFNQCPIEHVCAETLVEQIVATDADRDQNAQLLYRIQKGAFDDFAINISSGSVSVVRSLDFDRRSSYVMEVVAVDGGSPARTGTATLTVHILNNNDKSPQFSPSTQRTHISEDATVGTVFYQLAAHDPDAQGGLRYGLSGPTTAVDKDGRPLASAEDFKEKWVFQNYFSVEPATGKVEVARALERDRAAIVSLTVTAVDTSAFPPQTGTDVNDYPPAFLPPWTPESPRLTIAVPEEQPLGSAVTTLTATDPDSNIARYDIVPLSPYFDIEPSTGIVRTKARLDYEEVKQVKINVVAYDAGVPQMSAIAMVTVDVINVNDHSPVFNQLSATDRDLGDNVLFKLLPNDMSVPMVQAMIIMNQSVPEYLVTTVEAMDEDEGDDGKVTYSIKVGDKNVEQTEDFKINPKSGELWTRGVLDREVRPQYEIGGRQTETLKLKDEDDNVPEFPRKHMTNPYKMIVEENLPQGTLVGKVEAIDRDIGDNAHVYYYILDSDGPGIFVIDKLTGEIRTDISLDREQRAQYHLVVKATSNPDYLVFFKSHPLGVTVEERSYKTEDLSLALVEIQVGDQNDNEPVFLNTPYLAGVRASAPVGDTVLTVTVKDEDSGTNGSVTLRLESVSLLRRGATGPPIQPVPAPFTIEPSGQVVTTQLMTQFDQARFLIIVVAREDASPHRVVRATIKFWKTFNKQVTGILPSLSTPWIVYSSYSKQKISEVSMLWIYNPSQLVRLILTHPPEEVHSKKKNFTE